MKSRNITSEACGGFTLVELMVVVAIIGLLVVLVLPGVGRALDRASATQCASNLRQVGILAFQFATDHQGRIPGQEGIHADPGNATENPNGLTMMQELQVYALGLTVSHGHVPSGTPKVRYFICPRNRKSAAINANDLRQVSYKPPRAPWQRTKLYQAGIRYDNTAPRMINGMAVENYMLRTSAIPLQEGYSLADVIMLGEAEASTEGRIRATNLDMRPSDADGNVILWWNVRLSHSGLEGKNFLYFDGHARFESNFRDNFEEVRMSMWESQENPMYRNH